MPSLIDEGGWMLGGEPPETQPYAGLAPTPSVKMPNSETGVALVLDKSLSGNPRRYLGPRLMPELISNVLDVRVDSALRDR